jgi:hypothetical protein
MDQKEYYPLLLCQKVKKKKKEEVQFGGNLAAMSDAMLLCP